MAAVYREHYKLYTSHDWNNSIPLFFSLGGDKFTSITSGSTTLKSYTYDAAGRTKSVVTSAGTTSLSYAFESRVTGITYPSSATNSFTYNGLDTRVSKVDSGGTSNYVREGADVTDPVLGDGHATYTPAVSRRASSATTFDNLSYLGTSDLQADASQTSTATRTYDAFGNLIASTGTPVGPFGFAEEILTLINGEDQQRTKTEVLDCLGNLAILLFPGTFFRNSLNNL
jgi:YD repeat-containing protein